MQKKKNLMRLKTRPYYDLQGLVHTTGSAGGYDYEFVYAKKHRVNCFLYLIDL